MELRRDGYEEMQRRAELFSYIAELVRTQDGEESAPPEPAPDIRLTLLPKIQVMGQGVVCNGARLDLTRRPLSLKLFKVFCEKEDMELTREEVVQGIYDLKDRSQVSERFVDSLMTNSVKLISRTRIVASACFNRGAGKGIDWFAYDAERRVWCLYRLKSEYLGRRDA